MPSPGKQRGGRKSGQSGPRGGSRKGMSKADKAAFTHASKADMDKLAKMEAKMNKEIARQSKKDIAKYGSVREANKARKRAYDKTGKDPQGKWKSKSPDASKTAGENKTKRTGPTRIGGSPGSALARALLSGRYSR